MLLDPKSESKGTAGCDDCDRGVKSISVAGAAAGFALGVESSSIDARNWCRLKGFCSASSPSASDSADRDAATTTTFLFARSAMVSLMVELRTRLSAAHV